MLDGDTIVHDELTAPVGKPPLLVTGMVGVGDCIHQRAVLRELMCTYKVFLESGYVSMFHDLVGEDLVVIPIRGLARIQETVSLLPHIDFPPHDAPVVRLTYTKAPVLSDMFASAGLQSPRRPDFSLPVPDAWRELARDLIGFSRKPIMIYRPLVENSFWRCTSRNPDVDAYAALYAAIRHRFHVVSVADIRDGEEWLVGKPVDVDLSLDHGEAVYFETLAGLFAEADLVFCPGGFSPILSQAVGTPSIVVYGGYEGWLDVNAQGKHLAPTLPVEPDTPCRCRDRFHDCDKHISLGLAVPRVRNFVKRALRQ